MDFTAKEIILMGVGSGGLIGGLVSLFVFISSRLDERRKRKKENLELELTHNTDMRRLELDSSNSVYDQLWEIINAQKIHIKNLEDDAADLEAKAVLQRPTILKVYANIRKMRGEIESLGVMALDDDATKVFMRRFNAVKALLDDTEKMLP